MNLQRVRLLSQIRDLADKGLSTRQIARKLRTTVGKVAGILRDSSEAKREANNARRRNVPKEERAA